MLGAIIGLVALLLVLLGVASAFLRADPARLASGMKQLGPILLAWWAAPCFWLAEAGSAASCCSWRLAGMPPRARRPCRARRRETLNGADRSARNGAGSRYGGLEGLVLAGRHDGKMLGAMGLAELQHLYRELSGDAESRQLLETYLDGRFPVWRKNAESNGGEGLGVAPGPGAMTKEEAYKVLGLEAGAAAADVRKAHRRLMQRLHPDIGGTSFLAARINEAKDVLLSNHN